MDHPSILISLMAVSLMAATPEQDASFSGSGAARNIIFMVPDGMNLANVTAARIYKNGLSGQLLNLEQLPNIGYQRTYSASSTVTESPAAASAWACGEKFNNDEICFHTEDGSYNPSLLELARARGKSTGLVVTATATHATPAAFGAHVPTRRCETEIARQYLREQYIDVILGGGYHTFRTNTPDPCGTAGDFIADARSLGYTVVYTREELSGAVAAGGSRLLGLFDRLHPATDQGLTPEYLRTPDNPEPRLPDMTRAALELLEENPRGFFLLVEGSKADWANHANNLDYVLGELLAFDEAVGVVQAWIDADPRRKARTLLIVLPDHSTGGFAINGPYNRLLPAGGKVTPGWTTPDHNGEDTLIWSQGPGSSKLGRPIDNTDVYDIVRKAARLP